ncbi:hypothetical protein OT109_03535 [Phycisphaeraceae bacterium D3-23]
MVRFFSNPARAGAARRRLSWGIACAVLGLFIAGQPAPQLARAERDAPEVQPAALPGDVADAYQQLTGQPGDLAYRTNVALELIAIGGSDVDLALAASLGPAYNAEVWHATLAAINTTRDDLPRGDVPDVIVGMRRRLPADLEEQWAAALGRYEIQRISEELEVIARDQRAPLEQRRLAIIGIGHHRRAFAADVLIDLIDPRQRGEVQGWAFQALETLSHQPHIGRDREAWEDWWERAGSLNRTEWQRALHENLLLQTAEQRGMDRQLRDRLVVSQRGLYRATGEEDKPAVLASMLRDPLEVIRDLGMELARSRLVDGGEFPESIRVALRDSLQDDAPHVREQAATLLGQLSDQPGVAMMAQRLGQGEETVTAVQRQFLIALRRLPNAAAVDSVYTLLADRALQTEAAGALAAAAQAGMVDGEMARKVRERVLESLVDVQIPRADIVLLLGRVLSESDREWSRVEAWLDSSDDQVRDAAARVWAGAGRPLEPLARRCDDAVVRPVALRAIIERGDQPGTLLAIALKRPEGAADLDLWNDAMVAMAPRVPAERLLSTLEELEQNPADTQAVRLAMLTQAIERDGRPEDEAASAFPRLLIARAQTLPLDDDAGLVVLDYEAALPDIEALDAEDQQRLYRGLTAAYLAQQNADKAFETARLILVDTEGNPHPAASDDPLIQTFIDAIANANTRGDKDHARALLAGLRELFADAGLPAEIGQRLTDLEREVNAPPPTDAG